MAVTDWQQWIDMGRSLSLEGEELKAFVRDRQNEFRQQRADEREEKKESELRAAAEAKAVREKEIEMARMADARLIREAEMNEARLTREANDVRLEREATEARLAREASEALEHKRLEIQARLREIGSRDGRNRDDGDSYMTMGDNHQGNQSHKGMKNIKFPIFNEAKDCLDAYLLRFERTCTTYEIPRDVWSLMLARHLESKALEVYQRLSAEETQDYDCLKKHLLKRFQLTEGGYRNKFKTSKMEQGETPSNFIYILQRYLQQWLLQAGFEQTYEGIEDLLLKDQFFLTCSNELRMFIKEKGKMSLKDTLTCAESYIEAHGYRYAENSVKPQGRFNYDRGNGKSFEEKSREKFQGNVNRGRVETR